jgi:hypothetical protein
MAPSSADQDRCQTTWWPALCESARRARLPTPFARDLSKDAVPTAQGARVWSQATVCALLTRERGLTRGKLLIDQDDAMASDETPRASVR